MSYTIISGTNRPGSNTLNVARLYEKILASKGVSAAIVSLEGLDLQATSPVFADMQEHILIPTKKFILISPEYNGSYPGVLKTLIDQSDIKKVWWGKKALLTGVSTGRAGNLRGMEHLTGVLNYLKVVVHPNKLPISTIDKLLHSDGLLSDPATLAAIDLQLEEYLQF